MLESLRVEVLPACAALRYNRRDISPLGFPLLAHGMFWRSFMVVRHLVEGCHLARVWGSRESRVLRAA